jgi:hypothetical protein
VDRVQASNPVIQELFDDIERLRSNVRYFRGAMAADIEDLLERAECLVDLATRLAIKYPKRRENLSD